MTQPQFPVVDADNHLYETREALTKYLPEKYKNALRYVEIDGRTKIVVKGHISEYIPNPTFDVVARPGAQEEYYRKGNPDGKSFREIFGKPMKAIDAFREPASRLALMDEQGIAASLMFPTLASLVEERFRDDPEAIHAIVHALNQWLDETWSFNYENRIFTTPVITLPIVEKALEELDWVIERGAKCVLIRPAPVPGYRGSRSFGLPEFDPVWQKIVDNNLVVGMHSSDSGYERYTNDWLGTDSEFLPFKPQAFRMLSSWRPIEDSVAALACHGALTRFPDLKIAVIENGASWVEPLLKSLKNVYKKMPQDFPENPIEAIRRCIYISPFWEENYMELAELLGEDNVLFGSDFPHPEGLADPVSYANDLREYCSEEQVAKFMGGNLLRLLNMEAPVPA
ncbi:MAG TPA: amidohydrolase family protein [Nocardioides sp.]|nr:amidohydrolase family protein [Nocardioides sp.]